MTTLTDLKGGRRLLALHSTSLACFISDGKILATVHSGGKGGMLRRFQIGNQASRELQTIALREDEWPIAMSSAGLITVEELPYDPWQPPDWLPEWAGKMVESWQGKRQCRLRIRDSEEAKEVAAWKVPDLVISQRLEQRRSSGIVVTSLLRGIATLSPDGPLLAINDGEVLTLWEVPHNRPLSCWLTCGGLTLLATWVGWPRRGKMEAAAL